MTIPEIPTHPATCSGYQLFHNQRPQCDANLPIDPKAPQCERCRSVEAAFVHLLSGAQPTY